MVKRLLIPGERPHLAHGRPYQGRPLKCEKGGQYRKVPCFTVV